MKVFVATHDGQGIRESDFCDTEEGELLTFAIACGRDEEDPDGNCGCRRSLLGLESGGVTTTFTVAELPLSPGRYEEMVTEYFSGKGWFNRSNAEATETFRNDARAVLEDAAQFPVGVVLEKRGDKIRIRQPARNSTAFMIARARQTQRLSPVAG